MIARLSLAAACLLAASGLAAAQETAPPAPLTVTGSAALVTDYRFRGVSQSDRDPAIQAGITVTHRSGFYGGLWGSNLAGWGTFGGPNLELDLIGGYKRSVGSATVDVGLTWYTYPGGADKTDFAEPYAKLSGTYGPLSLTAGVAYAPRQQALGRWYNTGAAYQNGIPDRPNASGDNLYLWGDASSGIPGTRATVKAHIGHSNGNRGLGPNGTSVTPTGAYWDWLVGVDYAVVGPLTLGLAYVDTDLERRRYGYLLPNFADSGNGRTIAGSKLVFSVTASF